MRFADLGGGHLVEAERVGDAVGQLLVGARGDGGLERDGGAGPGRAGLAGGRGHDQGSSRSRPRGRRHPCRLHPLGCGPDEPCPGRYPALRPVRPAGSGCAGGGPARRAWPGRPGGVPGRLSRPGCLGPARRAGRTGRRSALRRAGLEADRGRAQTARPSRGDDAARAVLPSRVPGRGGAASAPAARLLCAGPAAPPPPLFPAARRLRCGRGRQRRPPRPAGGPSRQRASLKTVRSMMTGRGSVGEGERAGPSGRGGGSDHPRDAGCGWTVRIGAIPRG